MDMKTQPEVYRLGALEEIPLQGSRRLTVHGLTIAVFRTEDDQLFAVEDRCPHKHGPLSAGIVHGHCVTCPLHNWVISLKTGEAQGADEGSVTIFPINVVGGQIEITV